MVALSKTSNLGFLLTLMPDSIELPRALSVGKERIVALLFVLFFLWKLYVLRKQKHYWIPILM